MEEPAKLTKDACEILIDRETLDEALEAAVLVIQKKLGVTDGGRAALWWAGEKTWVFDHLMIQYAWSEGEMD